MSGSYKIIAKMKTKPDRVEQFKVLAAQLVRDSAAEPGNLHYSLNTCRKDPCLMVFTECWKDKAAIAEHNASEHFKTVLPQLLALCSEEPVTEIYKEI